MAQRFTLFIVSHKFESAIQKAIEQVATRVKYGLSKEVYKSIKNTTDKMPWVRLTLLLSMMTEIR